MKLFVAALFLCVAVPSGFGQSVPDHGDYFIRIGVYDFNSDHVGAVEVPVAAVANLPPVDVPLKAGAAPAPAKP